MVNTSPLTREDILFILSGIVDPEIPVVTIQEMGMLRDVQLTDQGCDVIITPTYTACPAMKLIEADIISLLQQNGIEQVHVITSYAPAWSTDWMSAETKEKLRQYGIAAPVESHCMKGLKPWDVQITCPRCASTQTELVSVFGSTACKALYRCLSCKEPFEYFKCH